MPRTIAATIAAAAAARFSARVYASENDIDLLEEYLPSILVPNAERVFGTDDGAPTAVGFQASMVQTVTYNADRVDFLENWTDLSDSRLKNRLLLWTPGDEISDGMLLGVTAALKMDYRNPDHVDAALDVIVNDITPNAVRYTNDLTETIEMFTSGEVDAVVHWSDFGRHAFANGMTTARTLITVLGQYPFNGMLWIPKHPASPILAQLYINWRLADPVQFPDATAWDIDQATWFDLHQGILGKTYQSLPPGPLGDTYWNFYPTFDRLSKRFWGMDWEYYLRTRDTWRQQWASMLN